MSKGPPPAYVPESDTRPLLAADQHLHPHGSSPFGTIRVSDKYIQDINYSACIIC